MARVTTRALCNVRCS